MAPELPLSGLVANIVAVPIGEAAALPLCLVHALLSGWPAAEQGCALAASGALLLVRVIARAFTWGALPVPMPSAAQLATVTGATCGVALGRPRLALALGGVMLAALEIGARVRGSPHGVLRVTFLDVGQGDSALVDFPDGSSMLVDAGGLVGSPIDVGERAVAQLLAVRRRKTLDAVVLSHPHPDHFLGLDSALARVKPLALWDTGQGEAEGTGGGYARLLADMRARGVPVLRPSELCGTRAVGGAIVEVLAPCPGLVADRGANDNSFVVRIRFGERAILLMGDAEHEEESELVVRHASSGGLRADVLKVGHHGSRTSSSSAFLQAVGPRFAVISCGVRNRFGHPHEPTLVALERTGAKVLRTDRHGSVVVTTDGRSLDVRTLAERASP
jgi:competence protein ComEC